MDRLELTQFAHLKPDRLPGATHAWWISGAP